MLRGMKIIIIIMASLTCTASPFPGISGVSELEPPPLRAHRLDSFIPMGSRNSNALEKEEVYIGFGTCKLKVPNLVMALKFPSTIDPTSERF